MQLCAYMHAHVCVCTAALMWSGLLRTEDKLECHSTSAFHLVFFPISLTRLGGIIL